MALSPPVPPPEPMPARRTARPLPEHRHLPGEPKQGAFEAVVDFDYGCDLFDARYYWEAHEVWEAEWRGLSAQDPDKEFLQGLICAAAFVVKQHQGVESGAERLLQRACERLSRAGSRRGVDVEQLMAALRAFRRGGAWVSLPIR